MYGLDSQARESEEVFLIQLLFIPKSKDRANRNQFGFRFIQKLKKVFDTCQIIKWNQKYKVN